MFEDVIINSSMEIVVNPIVDTEQDVANDPSEVVIEDKLGDQEKPENVTYAIASYGADYPVDGLVKRLSRGDIAVPDFQRKFVWPLPKSSRFIESLLLGLPVPGIFLSRKSDDQRLLVIDGQQRLETLRAFYDGVWPKSDKVFSLAGVDTRFNGKTYKTLDDPDRIRLDDSILHATIIKQESPGGDGGIYHIFERLNTGGVTLQPQEIRACIYPGDMARLLATVNLIPAWRDIFGKESPRLRDQELILRFFALLFNRANYEEPMKDFLNKYMDVTRKLSAPEFVHHEQVFTQSVELIHATLHKEAFRVSRVLNAAYFDALMVAVAEKLIEGNPPTTQQIASAHTNLLNSPAFIEAVTSTTASQEKIKVRIDMAKTAL